MKRNALYSIIIIILAVVIFGAVYFYFGYKNTKESNIVLNSNKNLDGNAEQNKWLINQNQIRATQLSGQSSKLVDYNVYVKGGSIYFKLKNNQELLIGKYDAGSVDIGPAKAYVDAAVSPDHNWIAMSYDGYEGCGGIDIYDIQKNMIINSANIPNKDPILKQLLVDGSFYWLDDGQLRIFGECGMCDTFCNWKTNQKNYLFESVDVSKPWLLKEISN